MNSQQYISMRVLTRTTNYLEDALDSVEQDGPNLAYSKDGDTLPFYSKIYLHGGSINNFFEIEERVKYIIKIYVFENDEEKDEFLLTEKQI